MKRFLISSGAAFLVVLAVVSVEAQSVQEAADATLERLSPSTDPCPECPCTFVQGSAFADVIFGYPWGCLIAEGRDGDDISLAAAEAGEDVLIDGPSRLRSDGFVDILLATDGEDDVIYCGSEDLVMEIPSIGLLSAISTACCCSSAAIPITCGG